MKTTQQIIACLLFLALAIKEGLSLECYSCNSFTNANCIDAVAQVPLETCKANETLCRKVEQHVYYNKEDHIRVVRQCATRGTTGDCVSRTGTYRFKTWYCHCSGKGCNSSVSLVVSISLIAAMFVACLGLRNV